MRENLYPRSPRDLPKNLTRLSTAFKFKVLLSIVTILLFFLIYAAMLIGLAYLAYWAIAYDFGDLKLWKIILKLLAVVVSLTFFIFSIKFIFKFKSYPIKNRIPLDKEKQKRLWTFIEKLCEETGASKPHQIYLNPNVDAGFSCENHWLSLIGLAKRDLTIGLGMVTAFNLSEFKAYISLELGHWAQNWMKVESYIDKANIIETIFDSEYRLDKALEALWANKLSRFTIAVFIVPFIWIILRVLKCFDFLLKRLDASISRERELNEDKFAVMTSGSEVFASVLWNLEFTHEQWKSTLDQAELAAVQGIFVKNLFTYYERVLEWHEEDRKQIIAELEPHPLGGKRYFPEQNFSDLNIHDSYPLDYQRENSAKSPFVKCEVDERSLWLLFDHKEKLQEEMSLLVYKQYLGYQPKEFVAEDMLEKFIENEKVAEDLFAE